MSWIRKSLAKKNEPVWMYRESNAGKILIIVTFWFLQSVWGEIYQNLSYVTGQ